MRFKNIIIGLCAACLLGGCDDYLDLVPEEDILTIDKIFEDRLGAMQWLNDINVSSSLMNDIGTNPAIARC